jgi:peroxiredoxin
MQRLKPILFFLVVGVIASYFVYEEARRPGSGKLVKAGDLAPDFSVKDANGNLKKLSDFRGKLVFFNLWYTDCVPCITEMPEMELVHNLFKDSNFHMMAVSVDANWDSVTKFYKDHSLTLPSYHDPGHQVALLYNVRQFPETFLIDANGKVLKHYVGAKRWASPAMIAELKALIPDNFVQSTSGRK